VGDVKYGAIPTLYAGVQFRSRTEARWAAMFDLLRWKWAYEPFDLAGYIPDFVIESRLMIEVKADLEMRELERQIPAAGLAWIGEYTPDSVRQGVIVGGRACHPSADSPSEVAIGVPFHANFDASWTWCTTCQRFTVFTHIGAWECWLCGKGGHKDLLRPPFDLADCIESKWREAGNLVQWRRPGANP